jgi:hypothetical protein
MVELVRDRRPPRGQDGAAGAEQPPPWVPFRELHFHALG